MFISIITPTYNRAYILHECYRSLCNQTCKDFEWIIIDDGSSDDTYNKVQGFIAEEKINIVYLKQENGGKHRAHNRGVQAAQGELIVCLDSDDQLIECAIERIQDTWSGERETDVIGVLALRGDFNARKPICSHIQEDLKKCTMYDLRHKYNFKGDTVLFFKTEVLKNNLFAEFQGERFLTEISLYYVLDKFGKMLLLNEVLYLCEYLEDGLTARYFQLMKNNPNGSAYTYYVALLMSKNIKQKLKYAILTQCYIQYANHKKNFKPQKHKILINGMKFVAILYRKFRLDRLGG